MCAKLDEARKASLEDGILVNPLKTESAEAVSAMIKDAGAHLEHFVQEQVLAELGHEGWLTPISYEQMRPDAG
jgi:hypothetical protein